MPDSHRLHRIEDLPRLAGATVAVRAWVTTTRSSGKISFVMLRDGTGYVQAVVSKKDVPDAVWQACGKLTQETSVEVGGAVRADPRAPGGGGGRARQGVLLRPHVPRRKVEDAPPPHRVLDGGAGSGLERLLRQYDAPGGVRRLHRGALPGTAEGRAGRAAARHGAARAGDAAVPPGVLHRGGGKAQGAGRGDGVGARPGWRRGDVAREAVRPPGHGL